MLQMNKILAKIYLRGEWEEKKVVSGDGKERQHSRRKGGLKWLTKAVHCGVELRNRTATVDSHFRDEEEKRKEKEEGEEMIPPSVVRPVSTWYGGSKSQG